MWTKEKNVKIRRANDNNEHESLKPIKLTCVRVIL